MKIFEITENISHTSKRLRDIEQERDVKIGSDEWFKLWFSLPYLKESSGHSYLLQLERDNRAGMLVLHILDQKTGKRTEVRGKLGYETNGYDPEDKLHQILDKVGKSASISDLMNGDVVSINPRHPQGPAALKVAHDLTNEADLAEAFNQPYPWHWHTRDVDRRWTVNFNDVEVVIRRTFSDTWDVAFSRNNKKEVTGEGDQFKIFATVIDILGVFVKQKKPSIVTFSAEKDDGGNTGSRSKLYSAMVKRFAAQYGYTTNETSSSYNEDDPGYVEYTLKRIEKNQDVKESNPFTDARMNAIKAGKTEFTVGGKTYKVTGDTSDEEEAVAKISESLDQPYPYSWYIRSEDNWAARARTDSGGILEVWFEYGSWDALWDIEFLLDGGYKATAEGDQFRIFATVVKAIKEWWKSTSEEGLPVKTIRFSADKLNKQTGKTGSRERLYSRFAQQFANSIGFTVQSRDDTNATEFELINPNYSKGKVNEAVESGKEMLKIFRGMHHDAGMNKDMDRYIQSHDWQLGDFTPDMFPSEEEFFDYDDPFDRIIDIDYSHRVNLSAPIIVGPQFSDGKYSVIDGNHRAATAQRMGKTIQAYFPVEKTNENFADGKNPGRKGLAKRMGVDTKASVSSLRKTAKNSSGETQRMAHWLANMKAGRDK